MPISLSKITSLFEKKLPTLESRVVVGLDIGSSAIKIVQLHDNKGVPTLDTYGELQLGPYADTDIGRVTNLEVKQLVAALVDIIREAGVTGKQVALAISYRSSFATIINVPARDAEEINSMVPVAARKYIPVALSEVALDWFPIMTTKKETKVLLAAIHNEALQKSQSVVAGANLKIKLSEIEMFSSVRSCTETEEEEVVSVVDFGAGMTKMYMVQNGVVRKMHSLQMSGSALTLALSNSLSISFTEAEELKRQVGLYGLAENPEVQKTLTRSIDRGFQEIHKVLVRFSEQESLQVGKIILTGSGSLLQGLPRYAAEVLQHPNVVLADPFAKLAYPAFLEDTLVEAGPVFAAAIGAALRGIKE